MSLFATSTAADVNTASFDAVVVLVPSRKKVVSSSLPLVAVAIPWPQTRIVDPATNAFAGIVKEDRAVSVVLLVWAVPAAT